MSEVWESNLLTADFSFLLIDARNAFNEQNREAMLWHVRHEWPSGARFTFNCYQHLGTLVIRGADGTGVVLYSIEGVTQGDPFAMFVYGIGMLPLTHMIKERVPDALTPWYADDAAAMAKFARIRSVYNLVEEFGPRYGYFPESTKSILVVTPGNRDRAVAKFAHRGFKVVGGSRYLGDF